MKKTIAIAIAAIVFLEVSAADDIRIAEVAFDSDKAALLPTDDPKIEIFENQVHALEDRTKADAANWTISERMKVHGVPGASVAIIENGQIVWAKGYGTLSASTQEEAVNTQTVFSAGSVSKIINASLILRLVELGELNLDTDVNTYLNDWKVPNNEFTAETKVTLRHLLSHTSGLSQHGFPDFQPGKKMPTILQTLNGERPARHKKVTLLFEPGTRMKYSGGGITVSQLIVETVTGLDYESAAQRYVLEPLGMTRSTFANPLHEAHGNIAKAHNKKGKPRALPRGYESFPESAASGLWTSADDLAVFVLALLGKEDFISEPLRTEMLTRATNSWHGMGPRLNGTGEKFVFHHGGANNSYRSWIEGHPESGNGLVILTNGQGGRTLAYELRIAAERAFGWTVNFPDDFDEPSFE